LGRPVQAVNEIITGKKAITPETAVALSRALGTSAEYWLNLESSYRLDLLYQRGEGKAVDVERKSPLFSKLPLKELHKLGWIDVDLNNVDQTERAVCRFLEIDSIDQEPNLAFAARKFDKLAPHSQAQVAWMCRVRHLARRQRPAAFSPTGLAAVVRKLPKLSATEADTGRVPAVLVDIGVRFVIASHLTGTKIDGATVWLDENSPVVAVSFRYDRVDWFWFTLMHEIAHVLAGDERHMPMIDQALVGRDADASQISTPEEKADKAAREWLIPGDRLSAFIRSTKPYYSRAALLRFASSLGLHPALVVGQLQNRGEIPYSHHRNVLTDARHLFTGRP
jgi:HTH-type transcriptional regulator/antitoxin HigA